MRHSEFWLSTRFVVYLIGTLTGLPFVVDHIGMLASGFPGRGRNQSFVGEPFAHGFLSKTAWVGARSTLTAYLSYKFKRLGYSTVSTSFYTIGTNM